MRRFALPALPLGVVTLLIALFAFAAPAEAVDGSISGTITDSAGNPVNDYCVTALRSVTGEGSTYLLPVRTGPTGAYTISSPAVTAGDYRLQFHRCNTGDSVPSNGDLIPEWWDDSLDMAGSDTFPLADGETITGKDAVLQIGGRISGTISGPGGAILDCANASLHGPGIDSGNQTVDGTYSFRRLLPGDYTMSFSDCSGPNGLSFEWYDNKPNQAQATTITLAPTEQRVIDATLEPGGAISGTVTNLADEPLTDVCVSLFDGADEEINNATVDEQGQFTFDGLFPTSYHVYYEDCDFDNNVAAEYFDDASSLATADPVVVTGGATTTADAQLGPGGSISGLVRGPDQLPTAGGCINVFDALGDNLGGVTTAANGTYRIGSLPTGTYRVYFVNCSNGAYLEYWNNKATLAEATTISVTSGSDHGGVNATLGAPDPVAPETTIASGPAAGSTQTVRTASFAFTSTIAGSSFQCRLDAGAWQACVSPRALSGLSDGSHTFQTRATSPVLLVDTTPAVRTFTVAAGPCEQARADLAAAEGAVETAVARVQKATKKLKKARRSDDAQKIKKAKRRLRKAKAQQRAAKQALAAAQAEITLRCG